MAAPYEVIAAPLTVYVAPVGTAKPAVNAAPSGSWVKLGTSGSKNYGTKGVVVTHNETIVKWRPAGGTGHRKAWRTEEFISVEFDLVDLTAEQYAYALNTATVTTNAGPPATKSIPLQQGAVVAQVALLARGISPINETLGAQYWIPIAIEDGTAAPAYAGEGAPAMLSLKFDSLEDATNGFGTWEEQTS
jgi:hypothetical protein